MHVDHHPLIHDFSEDREALQRLRQEDALFARQAEEYEALDKRICRIEDGIELLDDVSLQALKLNRVALKDELARQLKRASGQCCGCGNGRRG
ncbi:MAG TPA: GTP-binding protein [Pseudomonas sp.]|nr:GTP-binding protein [Pseudomonas sp.]